MRETRLNPQDFVYPVFVIEGHNKREKVASMPGIERQTIDQLFYTASQADSLGISALALFPVVDSTKKTPFGEESYNPEGLIPKAIGALKERFPTLGVVTDIALDPYTSHGQDGIINEAGYVLNDETIAILQKQAATHARAGADIIAPSDMMDGRVGAIRKCLDELGFIDTSILAYSAKYASSFYSPFRDAVTSNAKLKGSKESYQMDPANSDEAYHEVACDLKEGADIIMVKPALPYLDIIRRIKDEFKVPTFAYQVSGEYAMLKAASQKGWIDEKKCVWESLLGIKRAGADAIITYYALEVASLLKQEN